MDRQGDEPLMDQLRRERLLDMEERIGGVRRQAFAVLSLGVIASGPWIGFEFVIPLALLLAGFAFAARGLQRSRHPERWAAISWALAPAFIAACTPLSGGADSPALIWFAVPVATLGAALRAARGAARHRVDALAARRRDCRIRHRHGARPAADADLRVRRRDRDGDPHRRRGEVRARASPRGRDRSPDRPAQPNGLRPAPHRATGPGRPRRGHSRSASSSATSTTSSRSTTSTATRSATRC